MLLHVYFLVAVYYLSPSLGLSNCYEARGMLLLCPLTHVRSYLACQICFGYKLQIGVCVSRTNRHENANLTIFIQKDHCICDQGIEAPLVVLAMFSFLSWIP